MDAIGILLVTILSLSGADSSHFVRYSPPVVMEFETSSEVYLTDANGMSVMFSKDSSVGRVISGTKPGQMVIN